VTIVLYHSSFLVELVRGRDFCPDLEADICRVDGIGCCIIVTA